MNLSDVIINFSKLHYLKGMRDGINQVQEEINKSIKDMDVDIKALEKEVEKNRIDIDQIGKEYDGQ